MIVPGFKRNQDLREDSSCANQWLANQWLPTQRLGNVAPAVLRAVRRPPCGSTSKEGRGKPKAVALKSLLEAGPVAIWGL